MRTSFSVTPNQNLQRWVRDENAGRLSIEIMGNFLRFLALSQIVAFTVVFMPENAVASFHAWVGLGDMPRAPFLRYVLRGAAWCQGAFGVLFWVMASDVERYRPLIITTSILYLVAAPTFYILNTIAGLPFWWSLWDCGVCLLAGSVLLALCFRNMSKPAGAAAANQSAVKTVPHNR